MTEGDELDTRLVRTFLPPVGAQVDESAWPASVPAMAQLLREGLELPAGLTVLVGENGSGKSTVVETLAEACGLGQHGTSGQQDTCHIQGHDHGTPTGALAFRVWPSRVDYVAQGGHARRPPPGVGGGP